MRLPYLFGFAFLFASCISNTENIDTAIYTEYNSEPVKVQHAYEDGRPMCNGGIISPDAADKILSLTDVTNEEDIYTTYDRIDQIASLFEACSDPWGMFPTTYRHITNRIIQAIEHGEIEDQDWARRIVVDFASRYLANLEQALLGGEPSYAWGHYYYLADNADVSRTRAVVIAMVAHLTLDLPYSLTAIDTTEDHKDDYFVLGELMIEITPDFIEDLRYYYDTARHDGHTFLSNHPY